VSELEKELKLKQLSLKDIQKQLDTEKALSSKLYDDVSLFRDLYCVGSSSHLSTLTFHPHSLIHTIPLTHIITPSHHHSLTSSLPHIITPSHTHTLHPYNPLPPLPSLISALLTHTLIPHQLHDMGREHGKLKASHLKLLKESQQRETQLVQVAEAREKVLMEQQNAVEAHHLQETRLQATIAQQNKLINYLQGAPRSKLKIKKVRSRL